MEIEKKEFGKTYDGENISLFTLTNTNGLTAKVTNYGCILVSLSVPDNIGTFKDIVLGYDNVEKYFDNGTYMGAVIGRFSNRIKAGRLSIDSIKYQLALNDKGINHLHGGNKGFNSKIWNDTTTSDGLEFTYLSKDGEENYPGNLKVKVVYSLSDDNKLIIDYSAISDKATAINLTNHSYFNLEGHNSGSILNQELWINSDSFTATDENSIPTGEFVSVNGTPMDFNKPTPIGNRIATEYEHLKISGGYDHNWKLSRTGKEIETVASLYSAKTGIFMEVATTLPGIQIYTGNYLNEYADRIGKNGSVYNKHAGICFETQYFPNNINISQFESSIFKALEQYHHTTIFNFSVR